MMNDTCPWHLFHEEERKELEEHLFTLRACSAMLSLCLTIGILCAPSLKDNLSYQNILAFFISGFLRSSMPTAIDQGIIIMKEFSLGLSIRRCGFFGFLETLLAIHEVECLTHICIERYVVAKYITNDWTMPKWYYLLFRILCTSFAFVYSMAPLLGVGGYALDFICTGCTMDVILPEGLMKYIAAAIFALRSIKPAAFMIVMLIWAKRLESNFTDNPNNRKQKETTQVVVWLCTVYVACLAPIALVQGRILQSQLLFGYAVFATPSPFHVHLALILHATAMANCVMVLFLLSPTIREAFLNLRPQDFYLFVANLFKKDVSAVREISPAQN